MSYVDKRDAANRRSINIVELDLDAVVSPTGTEYHCDSTAPLGQTFWPTISKFDWAPTELIQSRGLGYRGVVKISFTDFSYGDKGTYFGKLLGRNPFYLDRKLKIHEGFLNNDGSFDFVNSIERLYFIKRIDGPTDKGIITITAKDPLTLLDKDQATSPKKSDGKLDALLSESTVGVTIDITDNDGFTVGGGVAVIEDEIIRYSSTSGAGSIVISERGAFGSIAEEHDAGSPVRECFYFENENCVDVIRDLIEDYTDIDHANYIDDDAWDIERDVYLSSELITGVIIEPTSVKDIIQKITSQTWVDVWWSDEEQEIKLKAIGPNLAAVSEIDSDNHILDKGFKIKRNAEKAITQAWIYYDKINLAAGDDPNNYRSLYIVADPTLEGASGHGREKRKTIFGSFLNASGLATATKVGSRILEKEGKGSNDIAFYLDAKDSILKTGDSVNVLIDCIQDSNGDPVRTNYRIVSKEQVDGITFSYKAVETGQDPDDRYGMIGPNTLLDYDSESETNKDAYAFISADYAEMPNGDNPYLIF